MNLVTRIAAPRPQLDFLPRMFVERGTKADWELLHHLHYKAENLPAGPRFWRLALDGETIGVIVTASPKLLLKERHLAFPQLKPGGKETVHTNTYRAKLLNQRLRVISRFVVDTMFRGIGCAYRFQNLASRLEGNQFMEIQSSMSKFNLFAVRAGFRFVPPLNSNKYEQGLRFFSQTYRSNPGDHQALMAELEGMPPRLRERVLEETRTFYLRHSALEKTGSGRHDAAERVRAMPAAQLIKNLQQMVLASPMYGVYRNPDWGRQMPERLPLTAFSTQSVNEPLDPSWFPASN